MRIFNVPMFLVITLTGCSGPAAQNAETRLAPQNAETQRCLEAIYRAASDVSTSLETAFDPDDFTSKVQHLRLENRTRQEGDQGARRGIAGRVIPHSGVCCVEMV